MIEIVEVQSNAVEVHDPDTKVTKMVRFEQYGLDLAFSSIEAKTVIDHPELPWELKEKVALSLTQMYGNKRGRAIEQEIERKNLINSVGNDESDPFSSAR